LLKRTKRRNNRPLAENQGPSCARAFYAQADIVVQSRDEPHDTIVDEIRAQLPRCLGLARRSRHDGTIAADRAEHGEVVWRARLRYWIGWLLASLGERIKALVLSASRLSPMRPSQIHLGATEAALNLWHRQRIVVPSGEGSKSYVTFENVCEAIIATRVERNDFIVALGGGVVGDLAGFAASCVRRGLDFVQVPTTLLAQVDSSVGGKTGINSRQGKNLIGAFHQPILVIADTALLDTLPKREFRAGYAEVAKYGLLGDAAFFSWLEKNWHDVFAGGPARQQAIAACCRRAKAGIVARE
jgi:3-dehydroquinate synthetase